MKLQGRIPVEPLDDERLTNIERRLVVSVSELVAPPARAPRWQLAFAGAALAVALAAFFGWKLRGDAPLPPAAAPQELALHTDHERATLQLDDATIASTPGTQAAVSRTADRVVITMTRGTLDLAVVHRAGRVLVIRAGDTEVEDVGTKFSVTYDGASSVGVRVTEGEVTVTRHQKVDRVGAGNEWTNGTLVAIAAEPAPVPAAATAAVVVASADDHPGSAAVQVAVKDPPRILHERHSAVPEVPIPHKPAHVDAKPVLGESIPRDAAREHPVASSDPYVDLKLAIRKQPIAFDPRIDGKADAAAEIARLKKVAYSSTTVGADASQALYRIAVLLHRPLGQDAEALHTLDMYRSRFARGKELAAALWLRVRIECGHAIDESCRRAAYSYQHEVVTGDAADVAIRITNAQ